jgi:hypothetical protein
MKESKFTEEQITFAPRSRKAEGPWPMFADRLAAADEALWQS